MSKPTRDLQPLDIKLGDVFISLGFNPGLSGSPEVNDTYARSEVRIYNQDCAVLVLRVPKEKDEVKVFGSLNDLLTDLGLQISDLCITHIGKFCSQLMDVFKEIKEFYYEQGTVDTKQAMIDALNDGVNQPQPPEPQEPKPDFYEKLNPFQKIGYDMGTLVGEKNAAYGNSFAVFPQVMRIMFPDGVRPDQYEDLSNFFRQFDKWSRIFTKPRAFGENPRRDLLGYNILGVYNSEISNKAEETE